MKKATPAWVTSPHTYRGPTSGVTLRRDGHEPLEVMFYDGATVSVPCDHPFIESLVAQGFLTRAEPAAARPASAGAVTTAADTPPRATANRRSTTREPNS